MPRFRSLVPGALAALAMLSIAVHPAWGLEECRLLRRPTSRATGSCSSTPETCGRSRARAASRRGSPAHEGIERFPRSRPTARRRVHRRVRRQRGRVHRAGRRRRAEAPDLASAASTGRRVVSRTASRSCCARRAPRAIQRYTRFFRIAATGGFEEMLALPDGGYASFSADGNADRLRLPVVRQPHLEALHGRQCARASGPTISPPTTSEKITDWAGVGRVADVARARVYYCSDRGGPTRQLWAYDTTRKPHRQVTKLHRLRREVAEHRRPDAIVFENGGALCVMDLPSGAGGSRSGAGPRRQARRRAPSIAQRRRSGSQIVRSVADREARRARGARRPLHGAGGEGRRAQPHATRPARASATRRGRPTASGSPTCRMRAANTRLHVIGSDGNDTGPRR